MNKSSREKYNKPFTVCSKCGGKLKFLRVDVKKINNGRFELYTYVYRCEDCKKQTKQDRIKVL